MTCDGAAATLRRLRLHYPESPLIAEALLLSAAVAAARNNGLPGTLLPGRDAARGAPSDRQGVAVRHGGQGLPPADHESPGATAGDRARLRRSTAQLRGGDRPVGGAPGFARRLRDRGQPGAAARTAAPGGGTLLAYRPRRRGRRRRRAPLRPGGRGRRWEADAVPQVPRVGAPA